MRKKKEMAEDLAKPKAGPPLEIHVHIGKAETSPPADDTKDAKKRGGRHGTRGLTKRGMKKSGRRRA